MGTALKHAPALAVLCLLLAGCASWRAPPSIHVGDADAATRQCAALFATVDAKVSHAGVVDGAEARVAGFPYLRANRFLASLRDHASSMESFAEWLELLRQTDMHARKFEWRNLADAAKDGTTLDQLNDCGLRLTALDVTGDVSQTDRLAAAVTVPDDYQTWKRVLGLYALARIPFAAGVRGYQRDTQRAFATPLDQLAVHGQLKRYGAQDETRQGFEPAQAPTHNPLSLVHYTTDSLARLLRDNAPIFEVDEVGSFDRGGALAWDDSARLRVDTNRPTVYHRVGYTRYQKRVLLQLQYLLWFPERPKQNAFDLLGGHLDGLVWRVTLNEEGAPILFDSIHPCGCYHQFFPTPTATLKAQPDSLDEFAFVPQTLPSVARGERLVIRLASRTHYIERVRVVKDALNIDYPYVLESEDLLRSLPIGDGFRSVYAADGLVFGTERGERFLFWPMGISSPGAMRQSGRQATAFVGRRHFDDAWLVDRYFILKD